MKKALLALILILSIIAQPISAYAYTINYTYDSLNRLTSVQYDNGQTLNYTYDPGGNLTSVSNTTTSQLQVVSTNPADGATNVPVDQAIYAVFNNVIQPGPSIADISIKDGDSVVSCTYSIDSTRLFIIPNGNLATSVAYSVYIPSGAVQDYYGNTLSSTYGFSFTTQATTAFPVVTGVSPQNNAVDVSVYQSVYFSFNENIQPGDNFSSIALQTGDTVVDTVYSIVYDSLTLTPEAPLAYSVAYSVYLPARAVQGLTGNSLANPYTLSFTTQPSGQATPVLASLNLSGSPSLTYAGQPFTFDLTTLTLTGTDQFGNAFDISGQTVTWSVVSGDATVSGSTLTITGAGQVNVTATVSGVTSNTLSLTVTQATPVLTALNLSGSPSLTYNGTPLILDLTTLALTGQDQFSQPFDISGQTVAWSVVSGDATVSDTTLTINSDGPVIITAGIGSITSNTLTLSVVRATPVLTTLDLSGNPALTYEGAPFTFDLTTLALTGADQFGNAFDITGLPVAWSVISGNATVAGSTLTINSAGQVSVTATVDGITSGILSFSIGQPPQPPSSDATLSSLAVNTGELTPAFSSKRTSYSEVLSYGTASISVTPTVNESDATVTVNDIPVASGQPSPDISLIVGSNPIKIVVTAQNGVTTKIYTLTVKVKPPVIKLSPSYIPDVVAENLYSETFTANGGIGPYTFTESGTLPNGISFNIDTLSGTTLATGSYPITITATDANGFIGSRSYTLTVKVPAIKLSPASLPPCTAEQAYSHTLAASGGVSAYTFSLNTGTLPAGLVLTPDGTLSGTTLATGSYPITVTATDANGFTGTRSYTLTVKAPTITVRPAALPTAALGKSFKGTFSVSGGATPYTFSETGTLPAGLSFNNNVLSGTPTTAGSFNFTVTATDAGGFTGARSYTLTL